MVFLLELYVPRTGAEDEARRLALEVGRAAPGLTHRGTLLVAEDETCFLLFDAHSPADLAAAADTLEQRPRIVEALEMRP